MTEKTTSCRSCGAPIRFIRSTAGKLIPVDEKKLTIVTDTGQVVSGYQSHFASCPDAEEWRSKHLTSPSCGEALK